MKMLTYAEALFQIEELFDDNEPHRIERDRAFGYYEPGWTVAWSPDEWWTEEDPSFDESEFICWYYSNEGTIIVKQDSIDRLAQELDKWRASQ